MKKLIVVADDFGFSPAYNYGVVQAYKEGIVTTLSLMSNMAVAEHAVALRNKECPEAPLVQHTNFVHHKPVSQPEQIPTLVDKKGMFHRSCSWRSEQTDDPKCKGDIYPSYEDFCTETLAQLNRHKELVGQYPKHFEGHSTSTKPMVKAFLDVGERLGIHNSSMPLEETELMKPACELLFLHPEAMAVLNRGCRSADWFEDLFGILDSPYEINILHFHPGYLDAYVLDNSSLTTPRCRDLQTLCDPSVRHWLKEHDITLVDFSAAYK